METANLISVLIAVVGIIGSGFSAYYGVRIAQAEMRGDISRNKEALVEHGRRLDRLEEPYFEIRNRVPRSDLSNAMATQ